MHDNANDGSEGDRISPVKFQDGALFLRVGGPCTLIRHENGAFRERSTNRTTLETPALRFGVDVKHFKRAELFENALQTGGI